MNKYEKDNDVTRSTTQVESSYPIFPRPTPSLQGYLMSISPRWLSLLSPSTRPNSPIFLFHFYFTNLTQSSSQAILAMFARIGSFTKQEFLHLHSSFFSLVSFFLSGFYYISQSHFTNQANSIVWPSGPRSPNQVSYLGFSLITKKTCKGSPNVIYDIDALFRDL